MNSSGSAALTALVADVGGTNARFAIGDLSTLQLSSSARFRCADFHSLQAVAEAYLGGMAERPKLAAFAVAAPVASERIQFTNSAWSFEVEELRTALRLQKLLVLNDFEALAHALPHLAAAELHQIGGDAPAERASRVVLGPGTGLGLASLVWSAAGWLAIASEGGHITFAVQDVREFTIFERLVKEREHLSAERVLSGPGLVDVYRVLADLASRPAPAMQPAEVVHRALSGEDAIAREALEYFATWLGRFAGDAALLFAARGGVYLGGGIAPRIASVLATSGFRGAFEAKGRLASCLTQIPVYIIMSQDAGLKGTAAALAARMA